MAKGSEYGQLYPFCWARRHFWPTFKMRPRPTSGVQLTQLWPWSHWPWRDLGATSLCQPSPNFENKFHSEGDLFHRMSGRLTSEAVTKSRQVNGPRFKEGLVAPPEVGWSGLSGKRPKWNPTKPLGCSRNYSEPSATDLARFGGGLTRQSLRNSVNRISVSVRLTS